MQLSVGRNFLTQMMFANKAFPSCCRAWGFIIHCRSLPQDLILRKFSSLHILIDELLFSWNTF